MSQRKNSQKMILLIAWPHNINSLETLPHLSNLALGRLPTKFDLLPTTKTGLATTLLVTLFLYYQQGGPISHCLPETF